MSGIKSVRLCEENVIERSGEYPCESILEGTPVETLNVCFRNKDENGKVKYQSGLWTMTVGKKYFECGVIDEICILIEGEAKITDADGNSETYAGGQAFILPAGFKGTWETIKPIKKYWAMHFNNSSS